MNASTRGPCGLCGRLPTISTDLATEEGLRRGLGPRQLTMIAIGSAIGVGLFLGSTVTIRLPGPAVIMTYVIGAAIALVMGYALAEMAVVHPLAGSFGVYAERYLSPWFGFVSARHLRVHSDPRDRRGSDRGRDLFRVLVSARAAVGLGGRRRRRPRRHQHGAGRAFGEVEYWFALIKVRRDSGVHRRRTDA